MNKRRSRVCKVTSDIFVHSRHVASHYGLIVTTGDHPSVIVRIERESTRGVLLVSKIRFCESSRLKEVFKENRFSR